MSNQPELKLQQDCFRFFHNQYPNLRGILWKVENERRRNKYEQMIAKSTGLVAGVADLNMLYNGQFYAIELKTPTGSQTKSQKEWQIVVEKQGGIYVLIRSLEKFKEFVEGVVDDCS